MGSNKPDGLLYLFERLLSGHILNKKEAAEELKVSTKTIERYINNIKNYLSERSRLEEVVYSREKRGYTLQFTEDSKLSKQEILAIAKVLLESKAFSKEEIRRLIQKLISFCSIHDRIHIKEIISNDLDKYTSPNHSKDSINAIWQLSTATKCHRKVKIKYHKLGDDGKYVDKIFTSVVYPQGIVFCEYFFYLIAFIEGENFEYPTIFKLDEIEEYKILKEGFEVDYTDRFKEEEFRNFIKNMNIEEIYTAQYKCGAE